MSVTDRRESKLRTRALNEAAIKTWKGTAPLMAAIAAESQYIECWRPVRAATALALATREVEAGHVWMTTEEFRWFWVNIIGTARKTSSPSQRMAEAVGISLNRRADILRGAPIYKVEALACAHASLGLPLPIPAGQHTIFADWVRELFGETKQAAIALEIDPRAVNHCVAGFVAFNGQRYPREPGAQMIRALDWLWRVGNVSPFGKRPLAPPFPSQSEVT